MLKIKISALDKKFSHYIRSKANFTCERCFMKHTPPTSALHCSHFHGRRKMSVRFDPENVSALCFGCHLYFTSQPDQHREWFRKRLGEKRYDALMVKANLGQKPDLEMIKIWLDHVAKPEFKTITDRI